MKKEKEIRIKELEKELKTLKDCKDLEEIRAEAVKWFVHKIKYRGNPYKIFLDFFNITDEELEEKL